MPSESRGRTRRALIAAATTVSAVVSAAPSATLAQGPTPALSRFHHTSWTARDGAPPSVEALAQTADGFLWLGGGSGLFRFDGVRFEPYESPAHQSLPSTNVSALLATRDGGLWVGYRFGGLSLIRRDSVTHYREQDGVPGGTVFHMVEDSESTLWVASTRGLAAFHQGRWRNVGTDEGFSEGTVSAILADSRRRLWVSAQAGVFMREPGATRFQRIGPSLYPSDGTFIRSQLLEAPDGTIWGWSEQKSARAIAPAGERREEARLPGDRVIMLIDRTGTLWFARGGHARRVRLGPRQGAGQWPEVLPPGSLSSPDVLAWLEDREGNVWAGTIGGLDRFRVSKLTRVELAGLLANVALAPADSGAVWVGSADRQLLRLGDRTREFPGVVNPVEVAYRDPAGVFWVGGPSGLWRSAGDRFERVDLPDVASPGIQAVTRDAAGHLWISIVRRGVFQRIGERWLPFGDRPGLPREPAIVLTTDDSGRTWLGYTAGRLALLHGDSVRLHDAQDGLAVGNVLAIHVRGSNVWVGGELGLTRLAADRFRPVLGPDGAAFRGVSGIVETPEGELWLHAASGIARIPAAEVRRVVADSAFQVAHERLDFRDGLDGSALQIRPQPTLVAGTDGRLWFATDQKVAWVDPRSIPRNPLPPPVVIRRLTVGQTSYRPGPSLMLPVRTTALRIDYTALSMSIPERVRFRYQLVGSDAGWQDAAGRREAFYTNLGPGTYRFRVIAANDDGVWNSTGASLAFTIPPTFTQSRWFLAVWVAALFGLAWLGYLGRTRQLAGRLHVRYQAALGERARIAQELHDTLLQGFTGITLQLRAIQRMLAQRPQESAEALEQVLESADTALREARHMIWDMRAVELEGRDLAEALETAAGQAMANSSARLVFAAHGDRRRLPLAVETTALRVGREAVLNAVKHAAPRTVEVNLEYGERSLTLHVADDGTGIDPGALAAAAAGEHLGIAGMRDRSHRAGGKLEITSAPGHGTTVMMSLPIQDSEDTFDSLAKR